MKQPPAAPGAYNAENERGFRQWIMETIRNLVYRDRDFELQPGARFILTSPNGTRYSVTVSNAGVLSATAV